MLQKTYGLAYLLLQINFEATDKMKRVVITGYGIVSCLGNDRDTVINSLKEGKSGIRHKEEYKEISNGIRE